MSAELATIIDFIRYGASRFGAAGLTFGHGHDNALDEATQLVLHVLHLPHDTGPAYGQARLVEDEKQAILALFQRRIQERIPACYLTGEAWFAGLSFKSDPRALVPRSPIAELIETSFQPWLGDREVHRVLDELIAAQLLTPDGSCDVRITDAGRELYATTSGETAPITARIYDGIPAEDLAVTGRVLSLITERAGAELTALRR